MKLFMKLYLGMMTLLVLALLTSSYFIIKTTLDNNIQHEIQVGLNQHNMLLNSFQTNLIIATQNKNISDDLLNSISEMTIGSNNLPVIVAMDDKVAFSNTDLPFNADMAEPDMVNYDKIIVNGHVYINYYSCFTKRDVKYTFVTVSEITSVISDNNSLRRRFLYIYIIVLLGGTVFALVYSLQITKPIKELKDVSEKIAEGDYSARITNSSNDEIGELSKVYNVMADTIQEKIDELELSAKQKEDFIAAFAHETKTPMTSIIGYGDLIYQDKLSDADRIAAAEVILSEGMRLQALSLKLLDIITLDKTNILTEEINTKEMSEDIENTIKLKMKDSSINVDLTFEDEYIHVDYDLFKSVIINLIDNSVKAKADEIKVNGIKRDDSYIIEVKDNGMGIPENELGRVKEAFYMVDKSRSRSQHGAGLGLALCDRIVKLHNGKLEIESQEGEGTTVSIILQL